MTLFSTSARLVCFIHGKPEDALISVLLFTAENWSDARSLALELARDLERSYVNAQGEPVEWRLSEVKTLDELPEDPIGKEIYSYRVPLGPQDRDPAGLDPDGSEPMPSGV